MKNSRSLANTAVLLLISLPLALTQLQKVLDVRGDPGLLKLELELQKLQWMSRQLD